jgi:hypothetical protein
MASAGTKARKDEEEFAYLPPPKEGSLFPKEEGLKDKFIRKTKENPFVPIGTKDLFYIMIHSSLVSHSQLL